VIAIDLVAVQTASKFRGIGKYTLALLTALERQCGPQLIYWQHRELETPLLPPGSRVPVVFARPQDADWLIVTSPFEGDAHYHIPIPGQTGRTRLACIIYDFIPLMWPERYLQGAKGVFYRTQLAKLTQYDRLLAISAKVQHEAETRLAVDSTKTRTLGAGVFEHVLQTPQVTPPPTATSPPQSAVEVS
jgi:hypothetical protein